MTLRHLLPAAGLCLALAAPAAAQPAPFTPGKVIVRYEDGASRAERLDVQRDTGTGFDAALPGGSRELAIEDGESVAETVSELRRDPDVEYAMPDYRLSAAQGSQPRFVPNDPGRGGPAEWRDLQWNFDAEFGVNAPEAWALSRRTDWPGGRGAVVAVIDSGVAFRNAGNFRRAPDLYSKRWTSAMYDFIDEDRLPLDEDGHGTHVTGTIAQATNNRTGVTGLAYGVTIMPLRVLNANGDGDSSDFVRAVRYAAAHGADVINMSVEYSNNLRADDVPEAIAALRYAKKKGAVLVAAVGNGARKQVSYPARSGHVIAVGATTHRGCLASYSNVGTGIDVVAPGGGQDDDRTATDWDRDHCNPAGTERGIWQQTFSGSVRNFRLRRFEGTSSAAPHVSALAALIVGTRRLGKSPSPGAVQERIQQTARELGASGYDKVYGHGLVDAAAALSR